MANYHTSVHIYCTIHIAHSTRNINNIHITNNLVSQQISSIITKLPPTVSQFVEHYYCDDNIDKVKHHIPQEKKRITNYSRHIILFANAANRYYWQIRCFTKICEKLLSLHFHVENETDAYQSS